MSGSWTSEVVNTLPLLLLGAVGVYFAVSSRKQKSKQKTSSISSAVETGTPNQAGNDGDNQGGAPQIFRDHDTGEYFIFDNSNGNEDGEPRPISAAEIYELTGAWPPEEDREGTEPPHQQPVIVEPVNPAVPVNPPGGVIGPEDFEGIADEQFDADLQQANQRLLPDVGAGGPGPATRSNRSTVVIGPKKAKSIERKEQRRAFFEHQRMQAMVDKQDDEEFERQYHDLIEAEREDRRFKEQQADLERKEGIQRQRLQDEAVNLEKDQTRRQLQSLEPGSVMKLNTDLEKEMAQALASSSSSSSSSSSTVSGTGSALAPFVVADGNWVIRFSESELEDLGQIIKKKGTMTFEELASSMTSIKK